MRAVKLLGLSWLGDAMCWEQRACGYCGTSGMVSCNVFGPPASPGIKQKQKWALQKEACVGVWEWFTWEVMNVQRNYCIGWDELRFSSVRGGKKLHWYKLHVYKLQWFGCSHPLRLGYLSRWWEEACGVGARANPLAWENVPTLMISDQLFEEEHWPFPPFGVLAPGRSSHLKGCRSALPGRAGGLLSASFRLDNSTCHLAAHVNFYTAQHAFQQTPKY